MKNSPKLTLLLLIIVVSLGILSWYASIYPYFPLDLTITRYLQTITQPFFLTLMIAISWLGFGPQAAIITILIIVLLFLFRFRMEALLLASSSLMVYGIGYLIKYTVHRPRATDMLVHVHDHLENGTLSFPAGHVMFFTAIYGALFYVAFTLFPKRSFIRISTLILTGFLITTIGISRVYLGDHWTSDAIGGYLTGTVALLISIKGYLRFKRGKMKHKPN